MEKKKYQPGKQVEDALNALEQHKGSKPGQYESQWKDPADRILHEIENRGPFHYDAGKDPMYQRALDQYVRLGRQAMMDTVGKTAGLTGGYGNSYAQTAGQQTFQGYLQALSMRLPQFHRMALDQYQAQGKDLMDRYQALSQREKDAYGQYQKILEQYYAREDRLQDAYDREKDRDYHRFTDSRDYDYAVEQDALEAQRQAEAARKEQERWDQDRAYQQERDKIRDAQWEREFAENQRRYEQQWAERHSGGGGGGGGRGYGGSYSRYHRDHGFSAKEYDHSRDAAKEHHHYSHRPSGAPWSPSHSVSKKPFYQVTLR